MEKIMSNQNGIPVESFEGASITIYADGSRSVGLIDANGNLQTRKQRIATTIALKSAGIDSQSVNMEAEVSFSANKGDRLTLEIFTPVIWYDDLPCATFLTINGKDIGTISFPSCFLSSRFTFYQHSTKECFQGVLVHDNCELEIINSGK